jgi:hypothetical protein
MPMLLLYTHPFYLVIVFRSRRLFNTIIKHDYVPVKFGSGNIVPINNDRLDDATVHRITTIGSAISKKFGLCLSSEFNNTLSNNELQFGLKMYRMFQCNVYVVQQIDELFNSRYV